MDLDNNASNLLRRSDQWPFLQRGVPAMWFHTGLHPDYHTVNDRAEKINYDKMEKIARLVHQVSWNLAQNAAQAPRPAAARSPEIARATMIDTGGSATPGVPRPLAPPEPQPGHPKRAEPAAGRVTTQAAIEHEHGEAEVRARSEHQQAHQRTPTARAPAAPAGSRRSRPGGP